MLDDVASAERTLLPGQQPHHFDPIRVRQRLGDRYHLFQITPGHGLDRLWSAASRRFLSASHQISLLNILTLVDIIVDNTSTLINIYGEHHETSTGTQCYE